MVKVSFTFKVQTNLVFHKFEGIILVILGKQPIKNNCFF